MRQKRKSASGTGRKSGRSRKKHNFVLDDSTKQLILDARITSLENDNYVEEGALDDDAYVDDEEEEVHARSHGSRGGRGGRGRGGGRGGGRHRAGKLKSAATSVLVSGGQAVTVSKQGFQQILFDQIYEQYPGTNNYTMASASPSTRPGRHICSVCGYLGSYSCIRCGQRFCSIRCHDVHEATRCLKFMS